MAAFTALESGRLPVEEAMLSFAQKTLIHVLFGTAVLAGSTPGLAESPPSDPEGNGEWEQVQNWPLIPLHMLTLPDGKVFSFGTNEYGMQGASFIFDVYDPKKDAHYTLPNELDTDIFCSHMALEPASGKVLIFGGDARKTGPGGQLDGVHALNIFDPKTLELSASSESMAFARWYPSVVTLSNGEILTVGGRNQNKNGSAIPEVWDGTSFRSLTGAEISDMACDPNDGESLDEAWWYPHAFQRSNGEVIIMDAYGDDVYVMTTEGNGSVYHAGHLGFVSHKMDPSIMCNVDKVLMTDIDGGLWSVDLTPPGFAYRKVADLPGGRGRSAAKRYGPDLLGRARASGDSRSDQNDDLRVARATGGETTLSRGGESSISARA